MNIEFPEFPAFKPVEFSDKAEFERAAQGYSHFADYNFNNFYSWDTETQHAISTINGNLVLRFSDYVTGEPFYSFAGQNKLEETSTALLDSASQSGVEPVLKLIPEQVALAIMGTSGLRVEEDVDSFDYIYLMKNISKYSGPRYKNKRRAVRALLAQEAICVKEGSWGNSSFEKILGVLVDWEAAKKSNGKAADLEYESVAIKRMLDISKDQNEVMITFANVSDRAVGFSIDELLPSGFVLSHYFKTLPQYTGLTEYFNRSVASKLISRGGTYWNWQQDLGIKDLRQMKIGYRPARKLRKYVIRRDN